MFTVGAIFDFSLEFAATSGAYGRLLGRFENGVVFACNSWPKCALVVVGALARTVVDGVVIHC